MKRIILGILLVLLFGCTKIGPIIVSAPASPIIVQPTTIIVQAELAKLSYYGKTSYELKTAQQGFVNIDSLRETFGIRRIGIFRGSNNLGYTYADVNFDGLEDIVYTIESDVPYKKYRPVVFIKTKNGKYTLDDNASMFPAEYGGSYDARKVITADFNNDSLADVLILGNGVDGSGNPNLQGPGPTLFLSQKGNTMYKMAIMPTQWNNLSLHGIAAGDINGDGNIDIVTDHRWPMMAYGNGDGTFKFVEWPQYDNYHIELSHEIVDVNGDGFNDIIMAGSEFMPYSPNKITKSVIFWNRNGVISPTDTTCIPIVDTANNDYSTIVDIVCNDIDGDGKNEIILDRTTGGQVGRPTAPPYNGFSLTFYKSVDNFKSFNNVTNMFMTTNTYPYLYGNAGRWVPHLNLYKENGNLILRAEVSTSNLDPYLMFWKQNATTKLFN
jgi:hypothetical protein